ncbi:nucleotidyltransferase domain-containing protein [Phenylobacterium terrae]|uniref:Nucleotidyltransferase domain-containing protein n=1 Tax=Phenylobacterium terrae TaxID=2665495 RepID=A0ABW4N4N1_9CAUL
MTAEDALAVYLTLAEAGVRVWLDGGWGVDALLGRQTRPHDDLDVVVEERQLARMLDVLAGRGFASIRTPDERPWNFVLQDTARRRIDVHVVVIDAAGNGIYGPPENGQAYPAAALQGQGRIGGVPVNCLTAEHQLASHTGYPTRPKDHQDVRALAEAFGLPPPPTYRR